MTDSERRAVLGARIGILERHASSLLDAFAGDEWRSDIEEVLRLVRTAKASLDAQQPLTEAEDAADAASLLLASIGRVR